MHMFISKMEYKIAFDNSIGRNALQIRKFKTFRADTLIQRATNLRIYIRTQKYAPIDTARTHTHTFTRTCTPLRFRYDKAIASISIMDISPCYKTGREPANVYVPKFLQMTEVRLDR